MFPVVLPPVLALLVMCTHLFAKKALTFHLARGEGCERYVGCNLMHRKVLASSNQHLMAEAPFQQVGRPYNFLEGVRTPESDGRRRNARTCQGS